MPQVIAFEDAKAHQARRKNHTKTPLLNTSGEPDGVRSYPPDAPVAYLIQDDAGRLLGAHFHEVDQFQIIVAGKGTLGRHEGRPYCVHFSRAYTPYGPLLADKDTGWSYLTLRARFAAAGHFLPDSKVELNQVVDRRPWQLTRQIKFPSQDGGTTMAGTVKLLEVPDMKDDQGLFASTLTMGPNTKTAAPDPSRGSGQYVVIVKGSLWHDAKEQRAMTVVFVDPKEGPFPLHSGAEGLEAIVLNFPQTKARAPAKSLPSASAGFRKWQCELCSFAYDEALGLPDDGIPAGTRWKDVPDRWTCPDCSSSKSEFQMVEVR